LKINCSILSLSIALRRTLYQKADEFGVHIQDMENILKAQWIDRFDDDILKGHYNNVRDRLATGLIPEDEVR
jgi:hypothetical protein